MIRWLIAFPFLLFISCLHSQTTEARLTVRADIKIQSGDAIVRIDGRVNENLHTWNFFNEPRKDNTGDVPVVREGSITKNETRNMFAGDEYRFSILPSEVVVINIRSANDNDVEIIVNRTCNRPGNEERHIISGSNRLGLTLNFQNR